MTNTVWCYLHEVTRIVTFIDTKSVITVSGGWKEGGMESHLLMEVRVSTWDDEKVSEMDGGDSYTTMWMYLMPLKSTLKKWVIVNFMFIFFTTISKQTKKSCNEMLQRSLMRAFIEHLGT